MDVVCDSVEIVAVVVVYTAPSLTLPVLLVGSCNQ